MKEEPIPGTRSQFQDVGGDESFGHDGLAGKILNEAHTLNSARFTTVAGSNIMGNDIPDELYKMERRDLRCKI